MAFTHRNSQEAIRDPAATTLIITKPVGLAVGDLMVAMIGKDDDVALTGVPSGWGMLRTAGTTTGNDVRSWFGYKIADAADVAASNFTWTADAEMWSGVISAFIPGNGNPVFVQISAHVFRTNQAEPTSNAISSTLGNLLVGGVTSAQADTGGHTVGQLDISPSFTMAGNPTTGTGNGDNGSALMYFLAGVTDATAYISFRNAEATAESHPYIAEFSDIALSTPKASTDSGSGTEDTPTLAAADSDTDSGSGSEIEQVEKTAFVEQTGVRYRNTDGTETTATWVSVINDDADLEIDKEYRVRFLLKNLGAEDAESTDDWSLYYEKNTSGTWIRVEDGTEITSGQQIGGTPATTQQLGAGVFISGIWHDAEGGDSEIFDQGIPTLEETEFEWTIYANSLAGAAVTDDYIFRLYRNGVVIDDYGSEPVLATIVTSVTPKAGTDSGSGVDSESVLIPPIVEQKAFRFRDDTVGLNVDSGWLAALNTDLLDVDVSSDHELRLRMVFENDGGTGLDATTDWTLRYRVNGGSYSVLGFGSGAKGFTTSQYANGDPTTQLLGSGSWSAGKGVDQVAAAADLALAVGDETEIEWAIQLESAELSHGDVLNFQIYVSSTPYTIFTQLPSITVSVQTPKADTDSGTSIETGTVSVPISDTDTGSGASSEATTATDTDTDAGSGTELEALAATDSDTDNGTGAETQALSSALSDTDTGSGASTEATAVPRSDTDSGTAAETSVLAASDTDVDAGSGDSTQSLTAALTGTDTGSDAEAESVSTGDTKTGTDTGSGTEGTETLAVAVANTDTGSGVDSQSLSTGNEIADTDTGSGADVQALIAVDDDTDSGSGTDIEALTGATVDTDAGTGADVEALTVPKVDTDTGTGVETEASVAAVAATDVGAGADDETTASTVADTDSGSGADVESRTTDLFKSDTDTGTAVETDVAAAAVSSTDDGLGVETETPAVAVTNTDTGTSAEVMAGISITTDADTGNAAENQSLTKILYDSDAGTGLDGGETFAPYDLADTDVGTGNSTQTYWLWRTWPTGRGLTDDYELRGTTTRTGAVGRTVDTTQPGVTDDLHSPGETS